MPAMPKLEALSLTLLGSFDPSIFHPEWFKYNSILKGLDADRLRIKIVHPEVAELTGEWFHLHALKDRVTLRASRSLDFERLCTLAHGIFVFLERCPVSVVQLRRAMHFDEPEMAEWKRIFHSLATHVPLPTSLPNPNLRSLELEVTRPDPPSAIRLRVEPSGQLPGGFCVTASCLYAVREDIPKHLLQILGEHCLEDARSAWITGLKEDG
jgi:hypothetical protein